MLHESKPSPFHFFCWSTQISVWKTNHQNEWSCFLGQVWSGYSAGSDWLLAASLEGLWHRSQCPHHSHRCALSSATSHASTPLSLAFYQEKQWDSCVAIYLQLLPLRFKISLQFVFNIIASFAMTSVEGPSNLCFVHHLDNLSRWLPNGAWCIKLHPE